MLGRVQIKIGLEEFGFERGRARGRAPGKALRPREAVRVVRRLGTSDLRRLEGFTTTAGRRTTRPDTSVRELLAELVGGGRVTVYPIAAKQHRPKGKIPEPFEYEPPEVESIQNEIAETHSVMITLSDPNGNPVPGEPFRIKLPDGTVETGSLDEEGQAYVTGITRAGDCKVCFYERDAAVWARI